jgi:hypothetical protein
MGEVGWMGSWSGRIEQARGFSAFANLLSMEKPPLTLPTKTRCLTPGFFRRAVVIGAAAGAVACAVPLLRPAWLWTETRWQVSRLDSSDPAVFSRAFAAVAGGMDPAVLPFLGSEADRAFARGDRLVYYQLVRAIHARCGVPFAPEDTRLPEPEDLRRMIREKTARSR